MRRVSTRTAIITPMASKRQPSVPLDTSPLEGKVGSRRAARAGRGVETFSQGLRHPPPQPSRGEGAGPVADQRGDHDLAVGDATEKKLPPALYRLMAWLSPAYPVGAFSYSSGLEWAVEAGDVADADALAAGLAVIIGEGGGFCDAVLFAHAHRAATAQDYAALYSVAELAAALAPSK